MDSLRQQPGAQSVVRSLAERPECPFAQVGGDGVDAVVGRCLDHQSGLGQQLRVALAVGRVGGLHGCVRAPMQVTGERKGSGHGDQQHAALRTRHGRHCQRLSIQPSALLEGEPADRFGAGARRPGPGGGRFAVRRQNRPVPGQIAQVSVEVLVVHLLELLRDRAVKGQPLGSGQRRLDGVPSKRVDEPESSAGGLDQSVSDGFVHGRQAVGQRLAKHSGHDREREVATGDGRRAHHALPRGGQAPEPLLNNVEHRPGWPVGTP